ncbi:MAG TPA: endonuclease/exonuclease/phosphatase family protein [Actinomycetales bacterium]|nr:endonuclease/exonuclease/phosphatase family protein [Actinomycetales bacterium]
MQSRHLLRVLTWNVRDMLGDPLAVHRVLRDADADVACLQEAYRYPRSRPRLAALARQSGMLFACGGRVSAGTAVLTSYRADVSRVAAEPLPVRGLLTRPRGWAGVVAGLPGTKRAAVLSIHLGLDAGERADHVRRVLGVVERSGAPAVAAGDLNEPPGGPSWQALQERLRDPGISSGPTFSAANPRRRIDAVLVDPAVEVVSYGWPAGVREEDVKAASDHRPVMAELRLEQL